MQPEKKQLEVLIMHYLTEYCGIFPAGKLVPSESPDFILKIKKKFSIGIELTRLNPLNAQLLNNIDLERDRIRDEIIDRAKTNFIQSSSLNLFVKFLFSDKTKINPESVLVFSARLTNLVRNAVKDKNSNSFFRETISNSSLPKGLDEVLIVHDPGLKSSIWERSNNLGVSANIIDDIRETILKKDENLVLYQKQQLNSYWLIITTDRLRGTKNSQLRNTIGNVLFHAHFEHVFLFDLMRAECHKLV